MSVAGGARGRNVLDTPGFLAAVTKFRATLLQ